MLYSLSRVQVAIPDIDVDTGIRLGCVTPQRRGLEADAIDGLGLRVAVGHDRVRQITNAVKPHDLSLLAARVTGKARVALRMDAPGQDPIPDLKPSGSGLVLNAGAPKRAGHHSGCELGVRSLCNWRVWVCFVSFEARLHLARIQDFV